MDPLSGRQKAMPKIGIDAQSGKCLAGRLIVIDNSVNNRGVFGSYEEGYRLSTDPIIAYLHTDVEIYEQDWDKRVLAEFEDPTVGLVGFGGAKGLGVPDLYRRPYELRQLARQEFYSNMRDAEAHGERFAGSMEVAILDGFCLIVRRALLDKCGGWQPEEWPPHHVYDMYIAAQTKRHGYRARMVGVDCRHRGGETATSGKYLDWATTTKWGSDQAMHTQGHRLFYDRFRDVLPWRCK